jgi:hypothetical protein
MKCIAELENKDQPNNRTQSINAQAHIIYFDKLSVINFALLITGTVKQTFKNIGALKPITQFRYAYY